MPSKSPKAAVDTALDRLRPIAACVTDRLVVASGFRPLTQPHEFAFAPLREPVPLRTAGRQRRLLLTMKHSYAIVEAADAPDAFEVRTTGYRYHVLDLQQREVLAYHWHPEGISPITYPHLHLSGRLSPLDLGPRQEPAALGEMHLPTGFVTLADVVRLLITEFGIAPRRADWEAILDAERALGRIGE